MSQIISTDFLKSFAMALQKMHDPLILLESSLHEVQKSMLELQELLWQQLDKEPNVANVHQLSPSSTSQENADVKENGDIPMNVVATNGYDEQNGQDTDRSSSSDTNVNRKRKPNTEFLKNSKAKHCRRHTIHSRRNDLDEENHTSPPPPPPPSPETSATDCENSTTAKSFQPPRKVRRNYSLAFGSPIEAQQIERKNTNLNMYIKNPFYETLCIYCNTHHKYLVAHYVKNHRDHEVPISRLSPKLSQRLRAQTDNFQMESNKIEGFCFFCDRTRSMPKGHWASHFTLHTGENLFTCVTCHGTFKRHNDHKNCSGTVVNGFELNASNGSLMAYMCKSCNYIQIHLSSMEKHLTVQHGFESPADHYERLTLIPDLSPVNSVVSEKYGFSTQLFKCTICTEIFTTSDEFRTHFDGKHNEVKQYDCFCGEIINKGDGGQDYATGKSVTAHALMHSTDLHQCSICHGVYLKKSYVRNHILTEHPNSEIIYQHAHRNNDKVAISETIVHKFKCNVCKDQTGGTFSNILNHFKDKHPNEQVDTSAIISKKQTEQNLTNKQKNSTTKYTNGIHFHVQFGEHAGQDP
ncbi:uncharacterized protein LOC116346154 [Contarinia nasturtii]|uniref:uncharacterized protein LOC116346154 n=1 Tax=Contarinia nasturtii TaxID=265458 RepID=UPI0012D3AC2E|nr:uncharacterized protein LOC116346154 [Contarinia nasturtii]XP_031631946.1 uncharacterized protein LOC116346154 [Contarinia nasturtii]